MCQKTIIHLLHIRFLTFQSLIIFIKPKYFAWLSSHSTRKDIFCISNNSLLTLTIVKLCNKWLLFIFSNLIFIPGIIFLLSRPLQLLICLSDEHCCPRVFCAYILEQTHFFLSLNKLWKQTLYFFVELFPFELFLLFVWPVKGMDHRVTLDYCVKQMVHLPV